MTYLLASSPVDDFEAWRSSFAENDAFRTEHGQRGYQVYQNVDDPNEVTVIFEWDENEDPSAFFESEEMRERLADAGLQGKPDLSVLTLVEQRSAVEPSA